MKNHFAFLLITILFASCASTFSVQEKEIIQSSEEKLPLRVFIIDNPQDSILLRTKSQKLNFKKDKELIQTLGKRMITTMTDSANAGVGIAAPQVGILKQMVVVQRFDKPDFPIEVFVNPEITKYSEEKQECVEGCLSIPGRSEKMFVRAKEIELKYQDVEGEFHEESVKDFTAVIFQHEIDHLNGILYIDYLKDKTSHQK